MKRYLGELLAAAGVIGLAVIGIPGGPLSGDFDQSAWPYESPTLISTHDYASEIDDLRAEIAREKRSLREAIRSPGGERSASHATVAHQADATIKTDSQAGNSSEDDAPQSLTVVPEPAAESLGRDSASEQLDTVRYHGHVHGVETAHLDQPSSVPLKPAARVDDRAASEMTDGSTSRFEEPVGPSVDGQTPTHFNEQRESSADPAGAPRAAGDQSLAGRFNTLLGTRDNGPSRQAGEEPFAEGLSVHGLSTATASGISPAPRSALDHTLPNPAVVEQNMAPSEADPSVTGNLWSMPGEEKASGDARPKDGPQHADWSIAQAAADGDGNSSTPGDDLPIAATPERGVTVRWQAPEAVNLGQKLDCQLLVENGGEAPALDVEVYVKLPAGIVLLGCEPRTDATNGILVWQLGTLMPAESKRIRLALEPQQPGRIEPDVAIKSTSATRAQIDVLEPKLDLAIEGPDQVTTGQAFAHQFHISNSGSGSATGVVLHVRMDSKLQSLSGEGQQIALGTLAPGQSRRIQLFVAARASGTATMASAVTCDEQSTAERARAVEIVRPQLQLALDGPSRRFIDRKATYVITVHNPGTAPAENVQIFDRVPTGFRFHEASSGGIYDRALRQVGWFVGRLEPNETTQVGVQLIATEAGEHRLAASVHADAGVNDEAHAVTRVEGAAAVALEVIDSLDPIEIGGETTYEIWLTNQGTGPAHQLQVAVELPEQMEALSAHGPTRQNAEPRRLIFDPLGTLQPGQAVVYKVHVRSHASGSARFRVYFRSAEEPEAVLEEETTRVYDE